MSETLENWLWSNKMSICWSNDINFPRNEFSSGFLYGWCISSRQVTSICASSDFVISDSSIQNDWSVASLGNCVGTSIECSNASLEYSCASLKGIFCCDRGFCHHAVLIFSCFRFEVSFQRCPFLSHASEISELFCCLSQSFNQFYSAKIDYLTTVQWFLYALLLTPSRAVPCCYADDIFIKGG